MSAITGPAFVFMCLNAPVLDASEQMQTHTKKEAYAVTLMLFKSLVASWRGIVVSGVSAQTLFIIIIIINHISSGVSGHSSALNHRSGHTWVLHLERGKMKQGKKQGRKKGKNVGGKKNITKKSDVETV